MKGHHCITNDLIKIAKVKPKLASIICEEADRLGITYNSIPDIMSRVGQTANSLYAAQLVNNKPSKEPKTTAVPDKSYPQSVLGDDYDSCVTNLSQLVSKDRAVEECKTQWKSVGSKTGSLKARSAKINAETKAYYSNICSAKDLANIKADNEDDCVTELQKKGIDDAEEACSKAFSSKKSAQLTREKIIQSSLVKILRIHDSSTS